MIKIIKADNLAPGQFGTGQFGTKIIKRTIWHQDNKSAQFGTKIIKVENLAPWQFGTLTIWHRTIWHQELKTDNLAPGQFGTKIMKRTVWHQVKIRQFDNIIYSVYLKNNTKWFLYSKCWKKKSIKNIFSPSLCPTGHTDTPQLNKCSKFWQKDTLKLNLC